MNKLIYAVGDIHGCYDQLLELQSKIDRDAGERPYKVVYLGDYVDRGPKSREVLELLFEHKPYKPHPKGEYILLEGNHEDLMANQELSWWLPNGGGQTIASYPNDEAVIKHQDLLKSYWQFLNPYHIDGKYLFVHAGIDPTQTPKQQIRNVCLWTRDYKTMDAYDCGYIIVHGHTPKELPEITKNRINIDTGCCWTEVLTAVVLDGDNPPRFLNTGNKCF